METSTPEHRLWFAVIKATIDDGINLIERLAEQISFIGYAKSTTNRKLQTIYSHVENKYFETICSFVDLHSDRVIKALDDKSMQLGINNRVVIDADTWDAIYESKYPSEKSKNSNKKRCKVILKNAKSFLEIKE